MSSKSNQAPQNTTTPLPVPSWAGRYSSAADNEALKAHWWRLSSVLRVAVAYANAAEQLNDKPRPGEGKYLAEVQATANDIVNDLMFVGTQLAALRASKMTHWSSEVVTPRVIRVAQACKGHSGETDNGVGLSEWDPAAVATISALSKIAQANGPVLVPELVFQPQPLVKDLLRQQCSLIERAAEHTRNYLHNRKELKTAVNGFRDCDSVVGREGQKFSNGVLMEIVEQRLFNDVLNGLSVRVLDGELADRFAYPRTQPTTDPRAIPADMRIARVPSTIEGLKKAAILTVAEYNEMRFRDDAMCAGQFLMRGRASVATDKQRWRSHTSLVGLSLCEVAAGIDPLTQINETTSALVLKDVAKTLELHGANMQLVFEMQVLAAKGTVGFGSGRSVADG